MRKKIRNSKVLEKSPAGTLDLLKKNNNYGEEENEKENDVKNKGTLPVPEELLTAEELRERFDCYLRGEVLDPPPLPAQQRWLVCLSKPLQKLPGLTYAELRERFHRRMEELRSTRPLPPPLAAAAAAAEEDELRSTSWPLPPPPPPPPPLAAAEDQEQQLPQIPDFLEGGYVRYPYAELRELNWMKKRQFKRKKREMEAAAAGAAEALTILGHVKIGDENKAAGRMKKKKRKKLSKLQPGRGFFK